MPSEPSVSAIGHVLRSERSLQVLAHLHEQRLQAPTDSLTVSVEELLPVVGDADRENESAVAEGRAAVLSKTLHEEWLPEMDACTMVEYDGEQQEVTATPRTTLFYLVVQPDSLHQRDRDEIAAACGWLAWREPFRPQAQHRNREGRDEDNSRDGGGDK